jgi:hypothetical protein
MKNLPEILPGMNMVTIMSAEGEPFDLRRGIVYDILGKQVILSQTSPPLRPSLKGKILEMSFITRDLSSRMQRWRFFARVLGFQADYEINANQKVVAIFIERTTGFQKMELRQFHRVKTKNGEEPLLHVCGQQVGLVDISMRGACFLQTFVELRAGDRIKASLILEKLVFPVELHIVRTVASPHDRKGQNVSVEFVNYTNQLEQLLGKRILMLEREFLCRL